MRNPFIISFVCHCIFIILCLELQLDTKKLPDMHIKSENSFDVSLNTPQKSTPQKPTPTPTPIFPKTIQKSIPIHQKKITQTIVKKSIKPITQKPIPKSMTNHKNHTNHISTVKNAHFTKSTNTPAPSLNQEHNINKPLNQVAQKNVGQTNFNEEDYIADAKRRIANHKFYPNSAKRRSIEGRVGFKISINPNGTIMSLKIIQSSGSEILDDAALHSVRNAAPFKTLQKTLTFDCAIQFSLEDN
jgi:periplasmic protein TonB